jgi:membrane peptidoglycan carboxypeptidase
MEATTVDGTGTAAAMSDGRPIIGKTGTTNSALSAFFIGAIPQYALAVGIFTESQAPTTTETLNGLGGNVGGGFGGYWPARIWNTFAQNVFLKLPAEPFQSPVFTGAKWNQVGNLPKKKPPKKKPHNQNCTQGHFIFNCPTQPPGHGHGHGPTQSPTPTATQTFPTGPPTPTQTQTPPATSTATSTATPSNSATATQTPPPGFGGAATVGGAQAGLALGGILSVLPGSLLWARVSRRRKRRRPGSPG